MDTMDHGYWTPWHGYRVGRPGLPVRMGILWRETWSGRRGSGVEFYFFSFSFSFFFFSLFDSSFHLSICFVFYFASVCTY